MLRQALVAFFVVLSASLTFASAAFAPDPVVETKPMGQLIWEASQAEASHQRVPGVHPEPLPLPPVDNVDAARRTLTVDEKGGRTPIAWVDAASAPRLLTLRPGSQLPAPVSLADEVLRLSALMGVEQDAAAIRASANAMPEDVRAPFAALVATVVDAYAAQLELAGVTELDDAQRAQTLARGESILAAFNAFRDAIEGVKVAPFADPEGLVVLGGDGDDTYTRGGAILDPVLLVDTGGNDLYLTTAGGACAAAVFHVCNSVAVSVLGDLAGADRYHYDGAPNSVQGSASVGGIGILVDVAGDDSYYAKMTRTTSGPASSYADGTMQGAANAGLGILLDGAGNDRYEAAVGTTNGRAIWNFGQGFGGYGGLGILTDVGGEDQYFASAYGNTATDVSSNFIGVYTNGVGFYGGVGIQLDMGLTNDLYRAHAESRTTDYYAQGFGAFGGVGIQYEDGGDDDYAVGHVATNPGIQPLLNCAFGTGSFGGTGIFLELSGNDNYVGYSWAGSGKYAYTMNEGFGGPAVGYGLFVDVSGDDGHFMEAHGGTKSDTFGRGVLLEHGQFVGVSLNSAGGGNHFGNYLDLGGADTYVGAPPSRDNGQWSGGADVNLVPSVALAVVLGE